MISFCKHLLCRKILIINVIIWMSCGAICRGHDLVDSVFSFPRVRAWFSAPPRIDADVMKKLGKDVILCVGATNRALAADYDQRYQAACNLEKITLSETELQVLYRFLTEKLGGRDPLRPKDLCEIKNRICLSLLLHGQEKLMNGLGKHLMEVIGNNKLHGEWRRLCIFNLVVYYDEKWKNRRQDWSDPERKVIEAFFWKLADDITFGQEAMTQITFLAKDFSEFKQRPQNRELGP